jgi:tRNA A-37 threonylcarbamoyl transferase component Bud32
VSLISTLKSIHKAGVLHSNICLLNCCITAAAQAFIVDFCHAGKSHSKVAQASKVKELCRILGIKGNALWEKSLPKKTVDGNTGLRRSSQIKILKEKTEAHLG